MTYTFSVYTEMCKQIINRQYIQARDEARWTDGRTDTELEGLTERQKDLQSTKRTDFTSELGDHTDKGKTRRSHTTPDTRK